MFFIDCGRRFSGDRCSYSESNQVHEQAHYEETCSFDQSTCEIQLNYLRIFLRAKPSEKSVIPVDSKLTIAPLNFPWSEQYYHYAEESNIRLMESCVS